jgi:hypothetical protein
MQLGELPFNLFSGKQWRLAIGLKPLPLDIWIDIGPDYSEQLRRKAELLAQQHDQVFASLPQTHAAQQEVLDLLIEHLLHYFPQHYQQQGDWLINRITEQRWNRHELQHELQPLDLAARLVQEDFCLMLPGPTGYVLSAASVCFPSRWQLSEKIGRPMSAIHQPVPDYDRKLERPVNHLFQRLQPGCSGYRLNWSLVDSPELFLPSGHGQINHSNHITDHITAELTAENIGEELWLRVERQTLRRLAINNSILFMIRTKIYPLHSLVSDPDIAHNLSVVVQTMSPDMQQYKSILPFRAALLEYLQLPEFPTHQKTCWEIGDNNQQSSMFYPC